MSRIAVILATLSVSATAALAHPGDHHLTVTGSLSHLLTQPDHVALIVAAVFGLALAVAAVKRQA